MKFRVQTSSGDPEEQNKAPCEGARLIDEDQSLPVYDRVWQVEINSLEELMELVSSTSRKRIVIFPDVIEIYDTWRE